MEVNINAYWQAVAAQDRESLAGWFAPGAVIRWHCTNERFTPAEFIEANCQYPGQWQGRLERALWAGDQLITVTLVSAVDGSLSCHVSSFFRFQDGKILSLDEYWADDGPPPRWRQEMQLGDKIV